MFYKVYNLGLTIIGVRYWTVCVRYGRNVADKYFQHHKNNKCAYGIS